MSGLYVCNACQQAGVDTRMPADEIGAALMEQHLWDVHQVRMTGAPPFPGGPFPVEPGDDE